MEMAQLSALKMLLLRLERSENQATNVSAGPASVVRPPAKGCLLRVGKISKEKSQSLMGGIDADIGVGAGISSIPSLNVGSGLDRSINNGDSIALQSGVRWSTGDDEEENYGGNNDSAKYQALERAVKDLLLKQQKTHAASLVVATEILSALRIRGFGSNRSRQRRRLRWNSSCNIRKEARHLSNLSMRSLKPSIEQHRENFEATDLKESVATTEVDTSTKAVDAHGTEFLADTAQDTAALFFGNVKEELANEPDFGTLSSQSRTRRKSPGTLSVNFNMEDNKEYVFNTTQATSNLDIADSAPLAVKSDDGSRQIHSKLQILASEAEESFASSFGGCLVKSAVGKMQCEGPFDTNVVSVSASQTIPEQQHQHQICARAAGRGKS